MNLGRHQLLQWVNSVVEADYPTIQSLSDGIAYCQIFEAIHPGSINTSRMTLTTKLPLDCLRNLRILQNALKNVKLTLTVSIQKMANSKFQDNIIFTQWLYNHAQKYGKENLSNYEGYNRRLQILERQKKAWDDVNVHLLPNEAYMEHEHEQFQDKQDEQDYYEGLQQKLEQNDLKQKMQLNWKMMHMINRSIDERNTLYSLLEQIQTATVQSGDGPVQRELLKILYETPEDFKSS